MVLLVIFHVFEGFCYFISNLYPYYHAVPLYGSAAFLVSLGIVYLHDFLRARYGWDALGLQYLNSLRDADDVALYQIFTRWTQIILRRGFWVVFVLGPVFLGPPVTTLMLRPNKKWRTNFLYTFGETSFNSLAWVALMKAVGVFTWNFVVRHFGKG